MEASTTDLNGLRKSFLAVFRGKSSRSSSLKTALETISFLRKVVIYGKYDTIGDLLSLLSIHGRIIYCAEPSELVIRNAVLMVTKLARDENTRLLVGTEPLSPYDSLNKLWMDSGKWNGVTNGKKLKKGLILAVKEVAAEMETCRDGIAAQANDIIQPQDVLIVNYLSQSSTLAAFLTSARSNKKFRVLSVAHNCEFDSSPDFVSPILLSDVGSKMCEVTKVVLAGVAVFPDGSCLVPAGGLSICLSAQRHSVPVYVLAAFYKITPFFIPDMCTINPQVSLGMSFSWAKQFHGMVEILSPSFDMLPSSLVTMYVSNSASLLPSHIYRLIGDYYHPDDISES